MKGREKAVRTNAKSDKLKTIVFKSVSMLLPFCFLLLLEVTLRTAGYGYNYDLFVPFAADDRYLVFNPHASGKYFVDPELATTGNAEIFKKEKDPHTLRIFVLGESTTIGYPYFHNASFHRLIQYRLMNTFPDKTIEVINLSLTAVNSYTVLGFARELPRYKPDAVLIYTGHNEYYGTLGVASTQRMGNQRWLIDLTLQLREWRMVQWLSSAYAKLSKGRSRDAGTRMKMMVREESIPFGSERYTAGIEQFALNLEKVLKVFQQNSIPVFVSNLVSNERNMRPFTSNVVDTVKYALFNAEYNRALGELQQDSSTAYTSLKRANENYPQHARCNYYLGQLALRAGDTHSKEYFRAASDLDGLRFRAPSAMNDVIGNLCSRYPNAHLVDSRAAFEQRSPYGIIGNELMLEHVHPNLTGYAILSDVFYQEMKKEKIFNIVYEKEMSFSELMANIPITTIDSLSGIYRISMLKKSWPFNLILDDEPINVSTRLEKLAWRLSQRKIEWQEAMDSLYYFYVAHNELAKAGSVVEGLVLEHPNEQNYWERAAMIHAKIGNKTKAIRLFEKAFDLAPTFERAHFLFVLYLQLDKPFEALPYINYGIKTNQSTFNLEHLKDQVEDVIRTKERLKSDSMNAAVMSHIAKAYVNMDNLEGATKYAQKALAIDAGNTEAQSVTMEINRKLSRL